MSGTTTWRTTRHTGSHLCGCKRPWRSRRRLGHHLRGCRRPGRTKPCIPEPGCIGGLSEDERCGRAAGPARPTEKDNGDPMIHFTLVPEDPMLSTALLPLLGRPRGTELSPRMNLERQEGNLRPLGRKRLGISQCLSLDDKSFGNCRPSC